MSNLLFCKYFNYELIAQIAIHIPMFEGVVGIRESYRSQG